MYYKMRIRLLVFIKTPCIKYVLRLREFEKVILLRNSSKLVFRFVQNYALTGTLHLLWYVPNPVFQLSSIDLRSYTFRLCIFASILNKGRQEYLSRFIVKVGLADCKKYTAGQLSPPEKLYSFFSINFTNHLFCTVLC